MEHSFRSRSAAVGFAFVLGLTLVVQALFSSDALLGKVIPGNSRPSVMDRRADIARRRAYYEALERCRQHMRDDPTAVCPDMNDAKGLRPYLKAETTKAAEAPRAKGLSIADLSQQDERMLKRYQRSARCPEALNNYLPGLYELCISIIAKDAAAVQVHGAAK